MNLKLWERANTLEMKINQEITNKKRDNKDFKKKLIRLAKHLELKGLTPDELKEKLEQ